MEERVSNADVSEKREKLRSMIYGYTYTSCAHTLQIYI